VYVIVHVVMYVVVPVVMMCVLVVPVVMMYMVMYVCAGGACCDDVCGGAGDGACGVLRNVSP